MKSKRIPCLVCDNKIDLGASPEVGQIFVCEGCDTEFELVALDPLTIDYPLYAETEDSEDDLLDEDDEFFEDDDDDDDFYDDEDDDDDY